MKSRLQTVVQLAAVLLVLALASCTTTDLTTNKTGWSDYSTIAIKDYTTVGHVRVTSSEVTTVGFLRLTSASEGSKVTYDMLLAEAKKLGADDIINVRIDEQVRGSRNLILDNIIGYTQTTDYVGNAMAIKYTTAQPNFRPDGASGDSGMLPSGGLPNLRSLLGL
jgi:hypothetical protein